MNLNELSKLVDETCKAFPGMMELVSKHPTVVESWAVTLKDVSLDDALDVLNRWMSGTLENPPIGFRRDMFALDIKAVADRVYSDWLRKKQNQELLDKTYRKKNRSRAFIAVTTAFSKFLEYNEAVINGTMTQEDRDWQVHHDIEELFAKEQAQ